jgi:hypothetical protein
MHESIVHISCNILTAAVRTYASARISDRLGCALGGEGVLNGELLRCPDLQ